MSLDRFRSVDIRIDKADHYFMSSQFAKGGDYNGRTLVVQITNGGLIESQSGITVNLGWRHESVKNSGLDPFEVVDAAQGIFEISYPREMLNPGRVTAVIQIIDGETITETKNFVIQVEKSPIDETSIVSSNSFTVLQEALIKVNDWNARIDAVEADFIQRANDMEAIYPQQLVSLGSQLEQITYQVKSNSVGDSTNINTKIDLISTQGGGTLLLPDKEYLIDAEIIFKSNVKLYSQQGTVLKQKNGANLANMVRGTTLDNINISNVVFDLNVINQPNYTAGQESNIGRCALITSSTNIVLKNVKTIEMFGTAFYIVDSENVTVEEIEIHDPFGRYISGLYLVRCSHAKISNSRFLGKREFEVASSSYGVHAKDTVNHITVDNCYFEEFQCLLDGSENGAATPINRGTSLKITNCTFQSPAADTTIRYCKFGLMSNNIVRDSGDYGLSVGDSEHVTVSDNLVNGSNTVGIGIRNSNDCIVSNNIVRDPCVNFRPNYPLVANQRVGIYIIGTSKRNVIDGNTITDFKVSPSQMFHAIRVEDYSGGVKGAGNASALITNNSCYGSSSGIDIYADGIDNIILPTNMRNDGKRTGIYLGTEPFYTPKLGDLRQNATTQKPFFYDGSVWRNIPKQVTTPTTPTSAGKAGDIAMNSSYFFWCPSDNVWCRVPKDATAW